MANFHPMGHLMLERKQRRSSPLREEAGQVTLELEATKRLTAHVLLFAIGLLSGHSYVLATFP